MLQDKCDNFDSITFHDFHVDALNDLPRAGNATFDAHSMANLKVISVNSMSSSILHPLMMIAATFNSRTCTVSRIACTYLMDTSPSSSLGLVKMKQQTALKIF